MLPGTTRFRKQLFHNHTIAYPYEKIYLEDSLAFRNHSSIYYLLHKSHRDRHGKSKQGSSRTNEEGYGKSVCKTLRPRAAKEEIGCRYVKAICYLSGVMEPWLNLLEETLTHFKEGAKSVKAYSNDSTYIITRAKGADHYWITIEESNFQKTEALSLDSYFKDVFGIEAIY